MPLHSTNADDDAVTSMTTIVFSSVRMGELNLIKANHIMVKMLLIIGSKGT